MASVTALCQERVKAFFRRAKRLRRSGTQYLAPISDRREEKSSELRTASLAFRCNSTALQWRNFSIPEPLPFTGDSYRCSSYKDIGIRVYETLSSSRLRIYS